MRRPRNPGLIADEAAIKHALRTAPKGMRASAIATFTNIGDRRTAQALQRMRRRYEVWCRGGVWLLEEVRS